MVISILILEVRCRPQLYFRVYSQSMIYSTFVSTLYQLNYALPTQTHLNERRACFYGHTLKPIVITQFVQDYHVFVFHFKKIKRGRTHCEPSGSLVVIGSAVSEKITLMLTTVYKSKVSAFLSDSRLP